MSFARGSQFQLTGSHPSEPVDDTCTTLRPPNVATVDGRPMHFLGGGGGGTDLDCNASCSGPSWRIPPEVEQEGGDSITFELSDGALAIAAQFSDPWSRRELVLLNPEEQPFRLGDIIRFGPSREADRLTDWQVDFQPTRRLFGVLDHSQDDRTFSLVLETVGPDFTDGTYEFVVRTHVSLEATRCDVELCSASVSTEFSVVVELAR
jgi:hypothetical protein